MDTEPSHKSNKGFNAEAFYKALKATVESRRTTWKQVGLDTGVGTTTLSRMSDGRQPDAGSLVALAAWAGLDISDFVEGIRKADPEPLALVGKLLRDDKSLPPGGADAIEAIVKSAYENFKKVGK
jgi:hypothetical protein